MLVVFLVVLAGLVVIRWHKVMPVALDYRHLDLPFPAAIDSESYLAMASGRIAEVASPFSKRLLYPLLAKGLADAAHIELPTAFLILSILSLAVLSYCLANCLEITVGHPLLAIPLLITPFSMEGLEMGYIPDLFHVALISLFFLLLLKERIGWSLIVLLIAFLARENTLVLCLLGAGVGYLRRHKLLFWGCLGVLFLGVVSTSLFAKLGQPNIHKIPDFLYLAAKVPYNFLGNVLGIVVWSDVRTDVGEPIIKWLLPTYLRIGADKEVGVLLRWQMPLNTFVLLLTLFGIGPLLLIRFLRRWRELFVELPLAIQLAFLYGLVSWLLGPVLGNWVERLIGYGWPVFWIALPYLICRAGWKLSRSDVIMLLGCHVLLCWLPQLTGHTRWAPNFFLLLLIIPYYLTLSRLAMAVPKPRPQNNPVSDEARLEPHGR